jgi:sortase A
MPDRRCVDDLTIEELEQVLLIKRREARQRRLRRYADLGWLSEEAPILSEESERQEAREDLVHPRSSSSAQRPSRAESEAARFRSISMAPLGDQPEKSGRAAPPEQRQKRWSLARLRDSALLVLEVAALIGLVAVLVGSLANLRFLNEEVAQAREGGPPPTPTPLIQTNVLPGSSSPPSQVSNIPAPYRDLVQPLAPVPIPTPGPQAATRIVIPAIDVDVPVVEGDDWEQLKKGVGHHINSANPGERGNCVLSGHNDVFGEVFRRLEDLELEDEVTVYTGVQPYRYVVKAKRIVEPTDVSVMYPTTKPALTLITCHPYLVDTHRLVVVAELSE